MGAMITSAFVWRAGVSTHGSTSTADFEIVPVVPSKETAELVNRYI